MILALETSTTVARVALVPRHGPAQATRTAEGPRFSDVLLPLVDELLRQAGLDVAALIGIACGAGPGHFTGLRVGLALAKGMALPSERPLYLISSLGALALDMAGAGLGPALLPCLDAGKGEVYAALAGPEGELRGDVWRETPEALVRRLEATGQTTTLGGPGLDRHRHAFAALVPAARLSDVSGPTAESVARLAWPRVERGQADALDAALPTYGRPPDITRPRGA